MTSWLRTNPFLALGILIAPIAVVIGFVSAGFGHGDYVAARVVLPFACALTYLGGILVTIVAFLQWPLYGFLIDKLSHKVWTIAAIVAAHGSLCWWLFTKGSENFR